MKSIWKFPLPLKSDIHSLTLPHNSHFLAVKSQEEVPVLYYLVNPKAVEGKSFEYIRIRIIATGQDIEEEDLENLEYLGTTMTHNGNLAWHIFRER